MAKGKTEVKPEAKGPDKPLKRIAVVGCSDTKVLAPYDDTSWDIWAMNNAFVFTKRFTKWFEIHPIKFENRRFYRRQLIKPGVFKWADNFRGQPMNDYMQSLANLNVPVYMQKHWDVIPKSVEYPLKEILSRFGNYFTNSVSYMIAMAIKEIAESGGKGEIGCWGVDMATQTEYGPQRPSCEFFLGIAAGMGIPITIPAEADLLKTKFLYGFQEREQVAWEAKIMQILGSMEKRRNDAQAKFEMSRNQIQQYLGAEQAIKEVQRIWSNLLDPKIWRDAS
jgi:hypothetical protein